MSSKNSFTPPTQSKTFFDVTFIPCVQYLTDGPNVLPTNPMG